MNNTGESKKQEFQKYLEKSGVIDSLTKVFVGLYEIPEKPANAVDFIREYLGASVNTDVDELKEKINEQNKLLADKEKEIKQLKAQLAELQNAEVDVTVVDNENNTEEGNDAA